jgi:hypothetical protein
VVVVFAEVPAGGDEAFGVGAGGVGVQADGDESWPHASDRPSWLR